MNLRLMSFRSYSDMVEFEAVIFSDENPGDLRSSSCFANSEDELSVVDV